MTSEPASPHSEQPRAAVLQSDSERMREQTLGYGHRAHSPDPTAIYGFDPGAPRILASDKRKRWTVAG